MSKTIVHHLILLAAISFVARANDQERRPAASAGKDLATIQREYKEAEDACTTEARDIPNTAEGNKKSQELWKQFEMKKADLFKVALQVAEANPKSESGFGALEWLLNEPSTHLPAGRKGLVLMTQQYSEHPTIGNVVANIAYYIPREDAPPYPPAQSAVDLLNAVAERNPDSTARGQAVLGLACIAKDKFDQAGFARSPDEDRLAERAEKAFELVIRDYGSCPNLRTEGLRPRTTLGESAESELFELRHLRIGHVAPDINGEDLAGAKFKLSDYRGKVILLVFWASWCGACMADVPHEIELVKRFSGRPFAMIGVNGDGMKSRAAKAMAEHGIPWRSFWNGEKGPGGTISEAWNVRGWPTIYVLDHEGVIRETHLHGKTLDDPLENLVAKAEASASNPK